tara:strand:- start:9620 stop:9928 length:309 start_codon:yes stop_codon:yes gene_type:complete
MSAETKMTFAEYYQHYLTLHQNNWTRRLHILGQLATLAYIGFIVHSSVWLLLLAAPLIVYPFAWSGHFFFEKNRPAAFSHPIWAKACDWVMLKDIIIGKIQL